MTRPTHGIEVDATGVAIGWFTLCGKHMILDIKKEDHVLTHKQRGITCSRCKERATRLGG